MFFKSLLFLLIGFTAFIKPPNKAFYQIKIYTINSKDQEMRLEHYLRGAVLKTKPFPKNSFKLFRFSVFGLESSLTLKM